MPYNLQMTKIFTEITPEDSQRIQQSLAAVEEWCNGNKMYVNLLKCSAVTFNRIKFPFISPYSVLGTQKLKHKGFECLF